MKYIFSDMAEFALLREPIRRHLEQVAPEIAASLFVALNEAANNALTHGSRSSWGPVTLQIGEEDVCDQPCVKIVVRDEGEGFDPSPLLCRGIPPAPLESSGRGLWIIRSLVDQVRYNERGNELVLIRRKFAPEGNAQP